jgi:hypothetical protein
LNQDDLNKPHLRQALDAVKPTNLAYPFRVLRQEEFKGVQFLRNTLDIVQTINPNDDLNATEALLQLCNPSFDRFLLQILYSGGYVNVREENHIKTNSHVNERHRLNADWERSDVC